MGEDTVHSLSKQVYSKINPKVFLSNKCIGVRIYSSGIDRLDLK